MAVRSIGHDGRRGGRGLDGGGGTWVGFSACSGEWTKGMLNGGSLGSGRSSSGGVRLIVFEY